MLCLCVGERVSEGAHPCGVSGERSLIQLYSAENITGAISSAALPLISLIIILLTYCTAICILRLDRSHCKLRTSFSAVPCFPSPGPHPPRCGFPVLSHIQDATHTHTHNMVSCALSALLKLSKLLTFHLFTMQYLYQSFFWPLIIHRWLADMAEHSWWSPASPCFHTLLSYLPLGSSTEAFVIEYYV